MGMRGYAGSPAERETRNEPHLGWRTLSLSDPLVAECLAKGGKIMMHASDRPTRRNAHYKLRKDAGGWHIRYGKRGTCKEYLTACEITFQRGFPLLFQFRTKEGLL